MLGDINGYGIEKANSEGSSTKYVFDLSGNMIEEIPEKGESIQYVFMGMTHIAQINGDESVYYFGTNHLGSTTLLTDESGSIIEDVLSETTPFGDQENKNGFYTGKQWDFRLASSHNSSEAGVVTTPCGYTAYEDVELYYFNARWTWRRPVLSLRILLETLIYGSLTVITTQ